MFAYCPNPFVHHELLRQNLHCHRWGLVGVTVKLHSTLLKGWKRAQVSSFVRPRHVAALALVHRAACTSLVLFSGLHEGSIKDEEHGKLQLESSIVSIFQWWWHSTPKANSHQALAEKLHHQKMRMRPLVARVRSVPDRLLLELLHFWRQNNGLAAGILAGKASPDLTDLWKIDAAFFELSD